MSPSFARSTRLRAKRPFPGLSRCLIRPRPFQAAAPVGAAAPRGLGAGGENEKAAKWLRGFDNAPSAVASTALRNPAFAPFLASQRKTSRKLGSECGGPAGTRTLDQRIKSPLLYQLSYQPSYARRRNCFFGFIKRNRSRLNEDAILLRRSILSTLF